MKKIGVTFGFCFLLLLTACGPVKSPVTNQYQLEGFHHARHTKHLSHHSILVSLPEALAGYQTEQMRYIQKPFELHSFAHNAWVSTPAEMLYPLMIQSLQSSHYFYAVVSGPYVSTADYRLDTQLIALQQNFLRQPSVVELVVKAMLTRVIDNYVLSTTTFRIHIPCPDNTPYGGVIAANKASSVFTKQLTDFVIHHIAQDNPRNK